jgi:actin-related protein 5
MGKRDFKRLLESNDFSDESQLDKTIKDLDRTIKRARKQDVGEEEPDEIPTFPLVDIPDEELDEEGRKQKRQQRLVKSSYDARQRAKAEKDAENARQMEEVRKDTEARESDLQSWIANKRTARTTLINKLKDRQRLRTELTDRKSLASQMRMKSIANLASDTPTSSSKKRRRGGANTDADDTFGANDDDWAVYRSIGTGGTGEDDEGEEDEIHRELKSVEDLLLAHDPEFDEDHTCDAQSDWRKSVLHAFLHGTGPFDVDSQAEVNQMHLNIERIRVPEVVFEPQIAGMDQSGIVEIASGILSHRVSNPAQREAIIRDVFCTGGNTSFKGFEERFKTELVSVLPAGSIINVRRAKDVCLDAWKGAAKWCGSFGGSCDEVEWKRAIISRSDYEEMGSDYLKEHRMGNALS